MYLASDPAPPYPGPPAQTIAQTQVVVQPQPVVQPQVVVQPQPVVQTQVVVQPQPVVQPQVVIQPQPVVQPVQYSTVQYTAQQPQLVQTVKQGIVVQALPTEAPGQMVCPRCQNTVLSQIRHKPGLLTWVICGALGVFLIWPCCLIPFCVPACNDVEHVCPSCQNILHIHRRM